MKLRRDDNAKAALIIHGCEPTEEGRAVFCARLRAIISPFGDPKAPLLKIPMPCCGRLYEFDQEDDIPLFDMPCGCGGGKLVLAWEPETEA